MIPARSSRSRDQAVQLLDHYIVLLMQKAGFKPDSDTHAELAACVDAIIDAAVIAMLCQPLPDRVVDAFLNSVTESDDVRTERIRSLFIRHLQEPS